MVVKANPFVGLASRMLRNAESTFFAIIESHAEEGGTPSVHGTDQDFTERGDQRVLRLLPRHR